ncbi:MAG: protein-L-isoaspartate(D-aspartate) O-methyltransferase [Candidatus Aenigmarchaeota archaeon]|nr:protein-L-isoaspartate(D-aspartate) O-methyltransferase [Candidatus Aenigmarchaeota archaeon]
MNEQKERLLRELIGEKWLRTKDVTDAFRKVPRENFVRPEDKKYAYANYPLPIPGGQTISQPLTVAVMTEALEARRGDKILEVGAGSGYQAAILSEIAGPTGKIITTEIIPELFEFAKGNLAGYENVKVLNIDGSLGCEKESPYDRIIVTASAPSIPEPLVEQLKEKGRLVIPVGDRMVIAEKHDGEISETFLGFYAFVPLTGEHGHRSQ